MKTILVVCTGNICRSPLVTGFIQAQIDGYGVEDEVCVKSAGIFAVVGSSASKHSVDILAEMDIDITHHIARTIDIDDIEEADLILVMEESQRRSLFHLAPQYLHKVLLFNELIDRHDDVRDPYGQDRAAYEAIAQHTKEVIEGNWFKIMDRLGV